MFTGVTRSVGPGCLAFLLLPSVGSIFGLMVYGVKISGDALHEARMSVDFPAKVYKGVEITIITAVRENKRKFQFRELGDMPVPADDGHDWITFVELVFQVPQEKRLKDVEVGRYFLQP